MSEAPWFGCAAINALISASVALLLGKLSCQAKKSEQADVELLARLRHVSAERQSRLSIPLSSISILACESFGELSRA